MRGVSVSLSDASIACETSRMERAVVYVAAEIVLLRLIVECDPYRALVCRTARVIARVCLRQPASSWLGVLDHSGYCGLTGRIAGPWMAVLARGRRQSRRSPPARRAGSRSRPRCSRMSAANLAGGLCVRSGLKWVAGLCSNRPTVVGGVR